MKTINVAKSFSLILKTGEPPVTIPAGVQQVDDAVAEHWYTKLHLANGGFGTEEYAKATRAKADEAFVKARDAAMEYEGLERAAQEAETAAKLDPVEPAYIRLRVEGGAGGEAPKSTVNDGNDAPKGDAKPKRGGRPPKAAPATDDGKGDPKPSADEAGAGPGQTSDVGSSGADAGTSQSGDASGQPADTAAGEGGQPDAPKGEGQANAGEQGDKPAA